MNNHVMKETRPGRRPAAKALLLASIFLLLLAGCGAGWQLPSVDSLKGAGDAPPTAVAAQAEAAPAQSTAPPSLVAPLETGTQLPTATANFVPTATASFVPTATASPLPSATSTPAPSATPEPTPSPTATSIPAPLSTEALLELAAPSLVQVVTQFASGNGFAVSEDTIVTAAHVVYPSTEATVYMPDGRMAFVPVQSVDLLADVALLGPIDEELPPLELRVTPVLQPQEEIVLVRYDQSSDDYFIDAEPDAVEGAVLQVRRWVEPGVRFYKTDVVLTHGDSGSPLLDRQGRVAGIISLAEGDPLTLLSLASTDLQPLLDAALAGDAPGMLAAARLDAGAERTADHRFMITDPYAYRVAYLAEQVDGPWEVELKRGNAQLAVYDCFGGYVSSTFEAQSNSLLFESTEHAPYFVVMSGQSFGTVDDLHSNVPLILFEDPDDEHVLKVGDVWVGAFDYPRDVDKYLLRLEAGQRVLLAADSFTVDTQIVVIPNDADEAGVGYDDDGGGGLRGLDALLTFEARQTGYHDILVSSPLLAESGAYMLRVLEANETSPAPGLLDERTGVVPWETEVGTMQGLNSPDGRLQVARPYSMFKSLMTVPALGANCHSPNASCSVDDRAALILSQQSLYRPVVGFPTIEEWLAEQMEAHALNPAVDVIEQRWVETALGILPVIEGTVEREDGPALRMRQLLLIDQGTGYRVTYLLLPEWSTDADLRAVIDYSFANLALLP